MVLETADSISGMKILQKTSSRVTWAEETACGTVVNMKVFSREIAWVYGSESCHSWCNTVVKYYGDRNEPLRSVKDMGLSWPAEQILASQERLFH
jgi:hypothetical protein